MLLLYLAKKVIDVSYHKFTFHYASTLSDAVAWSIQDHEDHLHSTMLLLYPDGGTSIARFTLDLHSTMLLLYRRSNRTPWNTESFTFHYASTLSEPKLISWILESCIYIPLCFYFILDVSASRTVISIIYIPLCFYFIDSASCQSLLRIFHLHSTMLLLYPRPAVKRCTSFPIYIPLCFYFILTKHLPLIPDLPFTFHYASTLSHSSLSGSYP